MKYNVSEYAVGWLFVAYKMVKKWWIYLTPFFTGPPTRHTYTPHALTHTHTYTHTHTHIRNDARMHARALAHAHTHTHTDTLRR